MKNYFLKKSVLEHSILYNELVSSIKNTTSIIHKTNTESHITDYHISTDIPRLYEKYVMPIVYDHMKEIKEYYQFNGINLHHLWFQWYKQGDFHDWHTHPMSHFTNIYYIKLPNTTLVTEVKDPFNNNKIMPIEISEGDILTIPGFFVHRAPLITDNNEKIIISFNVNVS